MTTPVVSTHTRIPPGGIAVPGKKRKFEEPEPLSEEYWAKLAAEEAEAEKAKFFPSTPAPIDAKKVQEAEELFAKWAPAPAPVKAKKQEEKEDSESFDVPEDEADWVPRDSDSDSDE